MSDDELRLPADEHAALRRVATLVARGTAPEQVFAAVVEEVGLLLEVDLAAMCRYESDGTLTWVATWDNGVEHVAAGTRRKLGGNNLGTIVLATGRSARMDNYAEHATGAISVDARKLGINSSLATPIMVEGRLWGVIAAGSMRKQVLPADTEARLANFTELVATAIANGESRAALTRLAAEQAALRRVATLVARGAAPEAVFAAVTEEIGSLLPADSAAMGRYGPDDTVTFVASWGKAVEFMPTGSQWKLGGRNVGTMVFETGRPVRIDGYTGDSGPAGAKAVEHGIRSTVGTPIIVEGRLWGYVGAGSAGEQLLPPDTEGRLSDFTELLATAIANAESRADLAASRVRIVAAADEMRRRIERDLHDGTQQRLVSLGLELRSLQAAVPPGLSELARRLAHVTEELTDAFEELRELSHGIHPAILSKGGLVPALRALRRRSPMPVELDLDAERRLPQPVEVAVYYVVSEALTNAVKHAHASVVNVELQALDTTVRLAVSDDGIGGADLDHGSGLVGLRDRIQALGGTLQLTSPPGDGTKLLIEMPLEAGAGLP